MSQVLINQYLAQLGVLRRVGGSHPQSVAREVFEDLLKSFAGHKEKVIDLLMRVTTVSLEAMRIVATMEAAGR